MHQLLAIGIPAWTPPNRHRIAGELLDEVYEDTRNAVETALSLLPRLNITFDESIDLSGRRIINLLAGSPQGAFFVGHTVIGDVTASVQFMADWAVDVIGTVTDGNVARLNAVCTDTCNTMLATHSILQRRDEFKHLFCILCDSHGLQLLIGDILKHPTFQETLSRAQAVVAFIRNSPKQHALLRRLQDGENIALITACQTRWSTQYRLLESLLRARKSLEEFAIYPDAEFGRRPYLKKCLLDDEW